MSGRQWDGARRIATALGVVTLVSVTAGCGADPYDGFDGAPPTTIPAAAPPITPQAFVQALDNNFRAKDLTVQAGTEVVWTNVGRNDHDVIPSEFEDAPETAPWGAVAEQFAPQSTYTHVFDTPGVYRYVCTIHGVRDKGMAGTITVTE